MEKEKSITSDKILNNILTYFHGINVPLTFRQIKDYEFPKGTPNKYHLVREQYHRFELFTDKPQFHSLPDISHEEVYKNEDDDYLLSILNQLISNDYLAKNKDEKYIITFKGIFFIEGGGYEKESELLSQEKKLAAEIRDETLENSRKLNRLTLILGIGTVALAVSEGIKLYHEDCCLLLPYLLLISIITGILILTLKNHKITNTTI